MPLDCYENGDRTTSDFLEKRDNLFFPNLRLLDDGDVFLASFARSGNDWMCCLVADLLQQRAGFATGPVLPVNLPLVVPVIYTDPVADTYKYRPELLRGRGPDFLVVKTHHLVRAPENRIILLFRQPADVFVSFYHFRLAFGQFMTRHGLDRFAEQILPAWCGYMRHFLARAAARPDRMLAVAYERLHADPQAQLRRILPFLGLAAAPEAVRRAAANHSFANRRRVEAEWRRAQAAEAAGTPVLARRGEVGEGGRALAPATLRLIEDQAMPLYRQALALA